LGGDPSDTTHRGGKKKVSRCLKEEGKGKGGGSEKKRLKARLLADRVTGGWARGCEKIFGGSPIKKRMLRVSGKLVWASVLGGGGGGPLGRCKAKTVKQSKVKGL